MHACYGNKSACYNYKPSLYMRPLLLYVSSQPLRAIIYEMLELCYILLQWEKKVNVGRDGGAP